MMIVSEYGSLLWIGSPYRPLSTDVIYNLGMLIISPSICNGIYQHVAGHLRRQLTLLMPCGITIILYSAFSSERGQLKFSIKINAKSIIL